MVVHKLEFDDLIFNGSRSACCAYTTLLKECLKALKCLVGPLTVEMLGRAKKGEKSEH